MTRKRKTRAVDKNAYREFLVKAKDFASMMDVSIAGGKWNSAGLQAVHAVISASDAVIVYYGGVRSIELDHREVVGLLHDIVGDTAAAAGRHVSRVIAKKNLVNMKAGPLPRQTQRKWWNTPSDFLNGQSETCRVNSSLGMTPLEPNVFFHQFPISCIRLTVFSRCGHLARRSGEMG